MIFTVNYAFFVKKVLPLQAKNNHNYKLNNHEL
jgi:hypothetical protein